MDGHSFVPDRPATGIIDWYLERKERCIDQIWKVTCGLIDTDTDSILALDLIRQDSRKRIYERMEAAGYDYSVYVLNASKEIRRERVNRRNREKGETFSIEVPEKFLELVSDMWETPDKAECSKRDIRLISTEA